MRVIAEVKMSEVIESESFEITFRSLIERKFIIAHLMLHKVVENVTSVMGYTCKVINGRRMMHRSLIDGIVQLF